ncbi:DUF6197 family protein [Streptomyces hydrogenans]|uniref:Uncharacterized protein n=1 Tax=Streptomyces hydrogenans TaxID=1873719 RepID=A0ABQ3PJI8_9ACTN|nr:hypothetical protein [Streptomyces hydrogenans]GHG10243.1 hypothetical protein GCM10018784_23700 [Streptomyces hydrogenans]GHI25178.1 hypothetical protein Shyd_65490 [Streptomyces hydrogenans]
MPEISKADVYRKAAEVIVRDGKTEGRLVEGTDRGTRDSEIIGRLVSGQGAVCAIGACARAEAELYGNLPVGEADLLYGRYSFGVDWDLGLGLKVYSIFAVNDDRHTSAEDIALLLKHRAEEIDGG